ncbi:MAG: hypothetical protein H7Y03_09645 [Chitinophagaceae bacterium]|nr:hypothetical protein [Chitinophagaceae bacterium]
MQEVNGYEEAKAMELLADAKRRKPDADPALRFFGTLISFIFHPLFIPFYITCFLVFVHPFAFPGMDEKVKIFRVISVFLLTAFFPAFTVFLLKQLHFISSIYLNTQKERIIPYIAAMFFYFWIFYVSRNLVDSSPLFVMLMLAVFISSITSLMGNIYFKVSMHAIAMGVMLTFFVILALQGDVAMGIFLALAIVTAGVVCTARLLVSDHYPFEIYAGFLLGVLSQVLAMVFV